MNRYSFIVQLCLGYRDARKLDILNIQEWGGGKLVCWVGAVGKIKQDMIEYQLLS